MDEFDKYFEKASKWSERMEMKGESVRKGNLQHDPKKKRKSRNGEHFRESTKHDDSKPHRISKSLYQHSSSQDTSPPPICLIPPDPEPNEITPQKSNSFYKKLTKKRNSKDSHHDSLKVSLLDHQVRRHSINPEEITASKLEEINKLKKDDCLVVRSFLTSPKGLVVRGDSFKRRASNIGDRVPSASQMLELSSSFRRRLSDAGRSHRSSVHGSTAATISDLINANASATSENDESICLEPVERRSHGNRPSGEVTKCYSLDVDLSPDLHSPNFSATKPGVKRMLSNELSNVVIVLGDFRVGKTSLITQFLSSEHLMGFENFNDDSCENIISVYIDGVETQLNFIEADLKNIRTFEDIPRNSECKAYMVMYSITDSSSFQTAAELAKKLCLVEELGKKDQVMLGRRGYSVIMVANKEDLVRNRKVSETEARELCTKYECKFIEVSASLSHNVNELLVGLVQQIKLNDKRKAVTRSRKASSKQSILSCSSSSNLLPSSSPSTGSYFKWFKKLFGIKPKEDYFKCDNFHTL